MFAQAHSAASPMINVCKEFQICFSGSFGVAPLLLASSLGRRREYLTERICEDEEREKKCNWVKNCLLTMRRWIGRKSFCERRFIGAPVVGPLPFHCSLDATI